MSHPVWVRGLKQFVHKVTSYNIKSHPVWVRGLKQFRITVNMKRVIVAPCMGAWIETSATRSHGNRGRSRTLYGCVD